MAAIAVLLFHLRLILIDQFGPGALGLPVMDAAFGFGSAGVSLFFTLSGFLLSLPYARAMLYDAPLASVGSYVRSRVLRIVPAYWVALSILATLVPTFFPNVRVAVIDYLFLQNYFAETSSTGLSVAWTLGIEVQFYAVLPVLGWLGIRFVRRGQTPRSRTLLAYGGLILTALLGLLGIAVLAALARAGVVGRGGGTEWLLPYSFHLFALGMALALAVAYLETGARLALPRPALLYLAALALVLEAMLAPAPWDRVGGIAWPVTLLGAVLLQANAGTRLLEQRWARWLGLTSYGIYLWHLPLLDGGASLHLFRGPSPWFLPVNVALAVIAAVAVASLSYVLVERPALRLRFAVRRRVAAVRVETAVIGAEPPLTAG